MADLVLVTVDGAGRPVARVGTWAWTGDTITAQGATAAGILDGLRLRSRWPDARLWRLISAEGWSNGQLAAVPPAAADGLPGPRPEPVRDLPGPPGTADLAGDAARQKLRRLERLVRRDKMVAVTALTEQARRQADARVRVLQRRIREHVAATGVSRVRWRERLFLDHDPPLR